MSESTAITLNRVPAWLVQVVDEAQAHLGLQSRSATGLALLAIGWHRVTIDDPHWHTEPSEMKAFGDACDAWLIAGGASPVDELTDEEWYLITEILPNKHGGKRPGAGRPKAK